MTEFSLYSIGVILFRLKKELLFQNFLSDTIQNSGVIRIRLGIADLQSLVTGKNELGLDFDDAYQYIAAEKFASTLISFDSDFDRTERGRKTPMQVLQG